MPASIAHMLVSRLVLLAVAAACLAAPALAPAQPAFYEVEYAIDFEATAQWKLDRTDENAGGTTKDTWAVETESKLKGTLENITFRNGALLNAGVPFGFATQTNSGGGPAKHESWDPIDKVWDTTTSTCTALPSALPPGSIMLGRDESAPAGGNETALIARFADGPMVNFSCPGMNNPDVLLSNYSQFPNGTFDAKFKLPLETIGMGTIIQHVSGTSEQQSPAFCPGASNVNGSTTRSCEFKWTGKLTFNKVGEWQYEGDLPTPPPTTGGGGSTPPPTGGGSETPDDNGGYAPPVINPEIKDPRAEAIAHAVEQYGKEPAKIDPRAEAISHAVEQYGKDPVPFDPRADAISKAVEWYGRQVEFEASCPTGCSGTAEILPRGGGGKARPRAYMAAAAKALAKLKFKVAPGARSKVRVKVPAKARKALKRLRGARVRITLVPVGGKPVLDTLALRAR